MAKVGNLKVELTPHISLPFSDCGYHGVVIQVTPDVEGKSEVAWLTRREAQRLAELLLKLTRKGEGEIA